MVTLPSPHMSSAILSNSSLIVTCLDRPYQSLTQTHLTIVDLVINGYFSHDVTGDGVQGKNLLLLG